MKRPAHCTYANQLQSLRKGYALFEPSPGIAYDKVRVGDVGYILEGKFMRFFNIFEAFDSSINSTYGVPEMCKPLPEEFRETDKLFESVQPGVHKSEGVEQIGGNLELSG